MFYVYEWYIIKTGEIFYVGKGCNRRKGQISSRNKLFKEIYKKNECDNRIIKIFENEKEAFEYEHERITELKEKGLCKCNLDYGGNGGCNFIWTPEMREYYSKNNVMKSENQRKRMSKENPMKNKKIAKIVGLKHRKPFYIGNKEFQTLDEASKYYNVTWQCIKYYLNKGHKGKEKCYYKQGNQQPSQ